MRTTKVQMHSFPSPSAYSASTSMTTFLDFLPLSSIWCCSLIHLFVVEILLHFCERRQWRMWDSLSCEWRKVGRFFARWIPRYPLTAALRFFALRMNIMQVEKKRGTDRVAVYKVKVEKMRKTEVSDGKVRRTGFSSGVWQSVSSVPIHIMVMKMMCPSNASFFPNFPPSFPLRSTFNFD